nr:hypothetical protein [Thermanaeromonas sp. C210]
MGWRLALHAFSEVRALIIEIEGPVLGHFKEGSPGSHFGQVNGIEFFVISTVRALDESIELLLSWWDIKQRDV